MRVKYVFHKDISQTELQDVIKVKSIAWPYSFEKQISWIKTNLKDDDIHVLLLDDNNLIKAYLNMILIDFEINDENYTGYGIGNVCNSEKGKGYGGEIMNLIKKYLKETKEIGLLFCKKKLISFYALYDWQEIDKSIVELSFDNTDIYTMIINNPIKIDCLKYYGKSF